MDPLIKDHVLSLSGCFPGAVEVAAGAKTPATATIDPFLSTAKYIVIPKNSIRYSGGPPNSVSNFGDGTVPSLTQGSGEVETQNNGQGDCVGESAQGYRQFARGVMESLSAYTVNNMTGVNTLDDWTQGSGNYVVSDSETLSRAWTSTLHYGIDTPELTDQTPSLA
jgi:hypothetical protein